MINHLPLTSRDKVFALLRAGATVITPNNRLSQILQEEFLKIEPLPVIEKPRCFPYALFLIHLYHQVRHLTPTVAHPRVITSFQQSQLWQQILSKNRHSEVETGLCTAIQDAWKRCLLWDIDLSHPLFATNEQTRFFQSSVRQMQQRLTELNGILPEQISLYLKKYRQVLSISDIIWACFDDYTPQQQKLQELLSQQECRHWHYDLEEEQEECSFYPAKDQHDEYMQLTRWLTERLAAGEKKIGVIVPDLASQSTQLSRLLQQTIGEEQFNLSLGNPLLSHPMVQHALLLLSLPLETITQEELRILLLSPYICESQSEFLARALFLENHPLLQDVEISFTKLISESSTLPQWFHLFNSCKEYPALASPAEWGQHFKMRLQHMGFPGEMSLDSALYQCYLRFVHLIDELCQLTGMVSSLDKRSALNALKHLAEITIFQTQTPERPVQILGLLEASGCLFESLWVSGLTDHCLPQKIRLSPFIPIALQRSNAMPHATPEHELGLAEKRLKRIRKSSQQLVLSYPRFIEDTPQMPSPLLSSGKPFVVLPAPLQKHSLLEEYEEPFRVPFTASETPAGDTALLSHQAQCPFRAFTSHRLQVKSRKDLRLGLDPRERGLILHRVMEKLWKKIANQQTLLRTEKNSLHHWIKEIIQSTLTEISQKRISSISPLLLEVEEERLCSLVLASLVWEEQRPPFTIATLEHSFTLSLGNMRFNVRVDRIDDVNGDLWVIDYKTSLPNTAPWQEERPQNAQLLVYALLDERINTLLFIELKAGHVALSGLSERTRMKGIRILKEEELWSAYQKSWRERLTALVEEFQEGYCPPQPIHPSVCRQCDFQGLCRYTPTTG